MRLTAYNKMSTIEDYQTWWPGLIAGFKNWKVADYRKSAAILIGDPEIIQYRGEINAESQKIDDGDKNLVDDVTLQAVGSHELVARELGGA